MNQTICLAVELEAFYKAEKKFESGRGHTRSAKAGDKDVDPSERMLSMMESFSTRLDKLQRNWTHSNKEEDKVKANQVSREIQASCGIYSFCYLVFQNLSLFTCLVR